MVWLFLTPTIVGVIVGAVCSLQQLLLVGQLKRALEDSHMALWRNFSAKSLSISHSVIWFALTRSDIGLADAKLTTKARELQRVTITMFVAYAAAFVGAAFLWPVNARP